MQRVFSEVETECFIFYWFVRTNIRAHSRNRFCRGKATNITYSQCVSVALVIHHAKRIPPIIPSGVVCPVLPYFPHFLINNAIELEMGVLLFSTTHVPKISHTKKKSAILS